MKYYKFFTICILTLVAFGCKKQDSTYGGYIKDGERIYAGIVDSIKVFPGRNRVKLSFIVSDATVSRVKITWNNLADSAIVKVDPVAHPQPYELDVPNLSERSYSFVFTSFNSYGNSSVKATSVGKVYGLGYESALLNTPVVEAIRTTGNLDNFTIAWGSSDPSATGNEITYTEKNNNVKVVFSPVGTSTLISGFKQGTTFSYRTVYLPAALSIDTFYSTPVTVAVK